MAQDRLTTSRRVGRLYGNPNFLDHPARNPDFKRRALRSNLVLRIGSGCGYKIRLNGADVANESGSRRTIRDQDAMLIAVKKGANEFEIELLADGAHEFVAQITDPSGMPVTDIN